MSHDARPGPPIYYPICGEWTCDDYDYDWETVEPGDPRYRWVKREERIAHRHQPRDDWRRRLQEERDKLNNGDPLWFGKW